MTTVKATLIQASNNLSTNIPVFTFRLTSTTKFWVLDKLGINHWFDKLFITTMVVTNNGSGISKRAGEHFSLSECIKLSRQVEEIVILVYRVFRAARGNGRLSGSDLQQAIDLFGKDLQNVLKQYKPGERHMPPGTQPEYWAVALNQPESWSTPLPRPIS